MSDTRYTKDHEWVRIDGDTATIGITAYAAEQLGDVVFVELPDVGRSVKKGEGAAVVESVKAASDVYARSPARWWRRTPRSPTSPATVNQAPEDGGWFMKLKIADTGRSRRAPRRSRLPRLRRIALRLSSWRTTIAPRSSGSKSATTSPRAATAARTNGASTAA